MTKKKESSQHEQGRKARAHLSSFFPSSTFIPRPHSSLNLSLASVPPLPTHTPPSARFNDYLFVQGLSVRVGMLSRCRYFAKKQLVWQIPLFGLGFWLIGFLLIDRNWAEDEKKIE